MKHLSNRPGSPITCIDSPPAPARSTRNPAERRRRRTSAATVLVLACLVSLLGVRATGASAAMTVISSGATAVSAGGPHDCAVVPSLGISCWGAGKLGNGPSTSDWNSTPVAISGLLGAIAVDASGAHDCVVVPGGGVKCWGWNEFGQLGDGTYEDSDTPVAVSGLSGVTEVSAGFYQTCALLSSGDVRCWGANAFGQLGDGTTDNSNTPVPVNGLSGEATAISTGYTHTCALLSGGTVECWGSNHFGELGDGTTSSVLEATPEPQEVVGVDNAVAVSAGEEFTCALLSTGTIKCWGWDGYGQLGNGSFGTGTPFPTSVLGITHAVAVSAGRAHVCALISDGTAECWGLNHSGELGNGTYAYETSNTPVAVSGLTGVTEISAGWGEHTCALLGGGAIECWGNNYGPIEVSTEPPSSPPMPPQDPTTSPAPSQATTTTPTSPKARITSHPPSETADRDAPFTFTGGAGGTYECSVDAGPWRSCRSGEDFGPLLPGDHRFRVRESLNGLTGPADSYSWTIDLPRACVLRVARARVFVFTHQHRVRLVIHYKTYRPAKVTVAYKLLGRRGGLKLGKAASHFKTAGIFRLSERLDKRAIAKVRATRLMKVAFRIPRTPHSCGRYYAKRLTIPKRIFGQTVWFQSDSIFTS